MQPTEYMIFVDKELNDRFANPSYPAGSKDTRVVSLRTEPIQSNPDGSNPLCAHRSARIDKVGIHYLCNIRWGVVPIGEVPKGVKSLDALAAHPEGNVELYLSVTNHANHKIDPAPLIRFNKEGKLTESAGVYKPEESDSLETSVRSILNLIA